MAGSVVEKPINQQYSFEIKKEVVDRFIADESKMDLAREFALSSDQLVASWGTCLACRRRRGTSTKTKRASEGFH